MNPLAPISLLATLALSATVLVAPCGGSTEPHEEREPLAGGETPTEPVPAEPEVEPEPEPPPPPPDPLVRIEDARVQSWMGPADVAAIATIVDGHELRDDVFAKLGGSSAATHSFLHCFAREDLTDLGAHDALAPTLEVFRESRVRGRDPFRRESTATVVGWSLRQGLGGRPSRIVREVRDIRARTALVFFGGNDVQGRNERTFGGRLLEVIEQLTRRGVVPVLGAVLPRGDDEVMDGHATRYNHVSRGIAEAHGLPYIDFHTAVAGLPRRGLASDGVHPNVLQVDGRGRPCFFTEDGLQFGQNQRNLRTLEALHRVRQALAGEAPDPAREPRYGDGTAALPLRLERLPFAETWTPEPAAPDAASEPSSETEAAGSEPSEGPDPAAGENLAPGSRSLANYGCEDAAGGEGPERVYRLRVDTATRLSVHVFGGAHIALLGDTPDPAGCVAMAEDALRAELAPGVHHLVVEASGDLDAVRTIVLHPATTEPPTRRWARRRGAS